MTEGTTDHTLPKVVVLVVLKVLAKAKKHYFG